MTHKYSVHDSDAHFIIDTKTRTIKDSNAIRTKLAQGDHKSERLTFEMNRYIDGHDMSLCNVEIHYNNISEDSVSTSKDIYLVNDVEINAEDPSTITFSWLVSSNATKYNGMLAFTISFKCVDDINVTYKWNTFIYGKITVGAVYDNSENVVELYSDILEQWKKELHDDVYSELNKSVDDKLEEFGEALDHTKDWNVNDSNDPAYIKNRPMYTERVTENLHNTLASQFMVMDNQYVTYKTSMSDTIIVGDIYMIKLWYNTTFLTAEGVGINAADDENRPAIDFGNGLIYYTSNNCVKIPWDIYIDKCNDATGIGVCIDHVTNVKINVNDEYLPLFQSDCNETDETKPGYIKNMPIKKENIYNMHMDGVEFYYSHYMTGCAVMHPTAGIRANTMWAEVGKTYTLTLDNGKTVKEVVLTTETSQWGGVGLSSNDCCEILFIDNDLSYTLWVDDKFWQSSVGVVKVTVKGNSVGSMLVKSDGIPLDKTFAVDSEKYRYGDALLNAVAGNRIPLVKIPNVGTSELYDNYVLPWQIQVPKNGNDYVNVFYTKDGFAQKLIALLIDILSTQNFANLEARFGELFGVMELQLHTPCEDAPIECEDPLD